MHKIAAGLMIGLASFGIAGCSLIGPSSRELKQEAYSMSQNAVEAVIGEDADALGSLFCHNTSDPDQIGDLLLRIDGNFKKYDDSVDSNLPVHFVSDSSEYAICRSEYISSDYMIRIVSCARSTYDKNDEGVQYIAFYEGDTLVASAGSVIERYTKNPVPGKKTDVDMDQTDSQGAQRDYDLNVLYYLNAKDRSGFASLFTEEMKDEAEEKYDDVLGFVGSGLKSYSVIDAPGGGSEWEKDHWNYMEERTTIYDIVTNDGDLLEISMNTVFVDAGHPSNEGITYFEIRKVKAEANGLLEHDTIESFVIGKDGNS